ncbi:pyridoxal 5'-phosphate synthase glutaminase subunit PdxT [Candidatus Kaiserbacteria bacterium]|nr:pyridoxal 5'-phosphate synthase glutaminase subunit PdxT [Candidatus Kaiserbacteria bacterium]
MQALRVGVLAFHGDVAEHVRATEEAGKHLKRALHVILVRTKDDLRGLDALIIPGGESTTLQKLCEREGMFGPMKRIKNIFGTCAGAILLAKTVRNKEKDQRTLGLMDIEVERNAYGRQTESFEKRIQTTLGKIDATFIRAPKIVKVGTDVEILAKDGNEILACEEAKGNKYYLALCFHPELTTTKFHEYFLSRI